ncbi:serine/threonine protein kinase [Herbidospora yilanensis]|uniref:serine/threonine protein kinase n=1 Tax=Herbidospora yilanensis TaxID=354426 RepID=UPI0007850C5C|nr:serine/threonine protein kinase [Herbidospora yilanensis]
MVAQGTTLAGRYRLDQRIGAGGMGEVWRGEDMVLARTVAVKVLLPGRLDDPGFGARFQGEARAMALINHPGVVDVYDYGVTDVPGDGPTAYLVMKFVDGEPLDRLLLRIGRIRPEAVMELIGQAAAAIQAVHDRGIVHRDVKPGNLLVQADGTLVLTDFGIARSDAASRLTDAGMVLGTAAYCAPEQAEGEPVTPAVDIYALGVVAYECLAGRRPFDGDTPVTIALKHIREQPPPLPADIPPHIRHVVERALLKSAAERWPTAAAMSQAARQAANPGASLTQPNPAQPNSGVFPKTGDWYEPPATGTYAATGNYPATGGFRTTAATPETQSAGQGGRRRQHNKKRGLTIVAIVAAVFASVGIGWAGVSIINNPGTDPGSVAVPGKTNLAAEETSPSPSPSRTRTPKPSRTPTTKPPVTEKPSVEPSEEPSPSPSPSPSPKPTPKPSPSPTKETKAVPTLWKLSADAAEAALLKNGFQGSFQTKGDTGLGCTEVYSQNPKAATQAPVGSTVTVYVRRIACPAASPSPSATPTATSSGAATSP